MSTARTPALNHAMNTVRPAYIGGWFSLEECEPKRAPRLQKLPLASGTLKVDTPTGSFLSVTSTMNAIWRGSRHSFTSDSFTTTTKSRRLPPLSFANSAISMPMTGSVVCAPFIEERRSEEHTSELQSRFDLVCRLL